MYMNKKTSIFFQSTIALFLLAGKVNAQQEIRAITTAVPFLLIAPDSRAGGMGDAGVATTPDANSTRWNPAKLAFVDPQKQMGFSLSYIPWLRRLVPDINLSYLSGYYRIDPDQVIGASLFYSSLGDITFTDEAGLTLGNYRPNEFAFDLTYSRKLSDYFSGGIAARYIYSNLTLNQAVGSVATRPGMSVAADISAYYTNPDIEIGGTPATISAGLNIANIGAKMSYSATGRRDFIPIHMRLGPALTLRPDDYNAITFTLEAMKLLVPSPPIRDPFNQNRILAGRDPDIGVAAGIFGSFTDAPGNPVTDELGDYVFNPDGTYKIESGSVLGEELREINLSLGFEYWYDKQFALRAGYFHEPTQKGNRKYVTFGAGLRYNVFGLDLAYIVPTVQNHPLANTLRFSLTMNFDSSPQN
jgi:hypothetical protein